jgi:hypothetical protein
MRKSKRAGEAGGVSDFAFLFVSRVPVAGGLSRSPSEIARKAATDDSEA